MMALRVPKQGLAVGWFVAAEWQPAVLELA
jgi:hypothetical protein